MPKPEFQVQPLGIHHERASFSCGVEPRDNFLKKQARQDVKKRVAAVFVLTPDGKIIAGYYTLSQLSGDLGIVPQDVARRLPKYPIVPATVIGRLAVSTAFRGQGLGELLLMDALHRSLTLSRQIASAAVMTIPFCTTGEAMMRNSGDSWKDAFAGIATPDHSLTIFIRRSNTQRGESGL